MNRLKKIGLILTALLLLSVLVYPAAASDCVSRLIDEADLLTDAEENRLRSRLNEISAQQSMDIVIVTVDSTGDRTPTEYADDYYDYNGYRDDGILLLVSMEERDWWICTSGYGITAFTDAGLEYMSQKFTDDLSDGEYGDAFAVFADLCDEFITQARTDRPYDVGNLPKKPFSAIRAGLVSIGIGLAGSFFRTNSLKNQLNTVKKEKAASPYVKSGSMKIDESRDLFLYRQLSRVQRSESGSGGSSVHTSSSGKTHGGAGGKF